MIYRITQLGEPVLRQKAEPVPSMKKKDLDKLINDMILTMNKAQGVGIAAPQIGKSLQLFIVAPQPSDRYPNSPTLPPIAMINPVLVSASKEMETEVEGCLSIPGIRGAVPRPKKIRIKFYSQEGDLREAELSGFIARIFQHEFDHIQGKVFLDRVQDTRTLMTEVQYRRQIK